MVWPSVSSAQAILLLHMIKGRKFERMTRVQSCSCIEYLRYLFLDPQTPALTVFMMTIRPSRT